MHGRVANHAVARLARLSHTKPLRLLLRIKQMRLVARGKKRWLLLLLPLAHARLQVVPRVGWKLRVLHRLLLLVVLVLVVAVVVVALPVLLERKVIGELRHVPPFLAL